MWIATPTPANDDNFMRYTAKDDDPSDGESSLSSSSLWSSDGAVALQKHFYRQLSLRKGTTRENGMEQQALHLQSKSVFHRALRQHVPVLVGSAGCSADCAQLKRIIRADLRRAFHFAECQLRVDQIVVLLSQVLYSRRGFPYYSFCIVAGLEHETGHGMVCIYDAIGSWEQVAVACTGTGRELLQPILDRKFRAHVKDNLNETDIPLDPRGALASDVARSSRMQRYGNIPLPQVDCTKDQAIAILLEGYRAVSEREITVGDEVAFCVLSKTDAGDCEWEIWRGPLKKH